MRQRFESSDQAVWRDFLITRIKPLAGRTVGSLTPEVFAALCRSPWLGRVREIWDILDDDIRAHYYAITARSTHETPLQETRERNPTPRPLNPTTCLPSP